MTKCSVYKYGSNPLEEVWYFKNGEKYVTSNGDIWQYNGDNEELLPVMVSPLDPTFGEENTMENLTEVQLNLFWKLCR